MLGTRYYIGQHSSARVFPQTTMILYAVLLCVAFFAWKTRRTARSSLEKLPGPPAASFFAGALPLCLNCSWVTDGARRQCARTDGQTWLGVPRATHAHVRLSHQAALAVRRVYSQCRIPWKRLDTDVSVRPRPSTSTILLLCNTSSKISQPTRSLLGTYSKHLSSSQSRTLRSASGAIV